MRGWAVIGLAALLAGCGSGDGGPNVFKEALGRIVPEREAGGEAAKPAAAAPARLTRAAIEASGAAMIRGRLVGERARSLLSAAAVNGGYVTYASRFGQTLTLRGALITASRGLGTDLLAVGTEDADPVASATPLAGWPETVARTYRLPGEGPGGAALRVRCGFETGQTRALEIVEITYEGVEVQERCAGGGISFSNLHFVEPETGRIWRSRQWLGPDQGAIDLEVLEPYTGG